MSSEHQHDHDGLDGSKSRRGLLRLASLALGLAVAAIFLVAIFSYQVSETEYVVVTTFDKIDPALPGPGLSFRWPYPVQKIHRFDKRFRCVTGSSGKLEEASTSDGKLIVISLFAYYRISDPLVFFKSLKTVGDAEVKVNEVLRSAKINAVARHGFANFVNTNPEKMQMGQIEAEILDEVKTVANKQYGIEIKCVGVRFLGLPESITKSVFERMKQERDTIANDYRKKGVRIADEIVAEAEKQKELKLAEANAEAKRIRGEGDAKAAFFYAAFKKDPGLAAFLRKLDALKRVLDQKTTLILDDKTPPFDLLGEGYGKFIEGTAKPK